MGHGLLYFDTRCPFGLRSSVLVCQRTTRAVIHVFTKEGYSADVYLDNFYGAEHPADSHFTFTCLQDLFDELGLQSSPEKDCHPSKRMICLGILVDTEKMLFKVAADRLSHLKTELLQWTQFSTFNTASIAIVTRETVICHSLCSARPDIYVPPFKSLAQFAF